MSSLAEPQSSALKGSVYMLVATVLFASMHGAVRFLSSEIHPFEVAFFRNLLGMLVLVPWFVSQGLAPLRTRHFGLHLQRAVLNVFAMLAFFTALSLSPIALVQALGFTAPLFTTLLAVIFLGEQVRLRRWSAVMVGFVGTVIIIRPGVQPMDLGALLTLASAAIWAVCIIFIKQLARTDSAVTITAYMVLLMTPLSLIPAVFVWTWPGPEQFVWLAATGILGTLAQMLMTQAFRVADTTVVLPLDFTKIIWGAIIGMVFFQQQVDTLTWVGAVIIFCGGTYITLRERQLERQRAQNSRGQIS